MNRTKINKFISWWLLHALVCWAVTNVYTCIDYYLRIKEAGRYFIFYEDGSPLTVARNFYNQNRYEYIWLKVLVFVWLVELLRFNFYTRKKFPVFIFSALAGGLVWSILSKSFYHIKLHETFTLTNTVKIDIVIYFTLYTILYAVTVEFIVQKLYQQKTRVAKSQAELNALLAQVNPHFFFNTFNYVYGTAIQEQAVKTAEAIEMMAGMMRYTMSVMQEKLTPLNGEFRFIRNYISLQHLRLPQSEDMEIITAIPETCPAEDMIMPMLLIPLVENVFKYGISTDRKCRVKIDINIINSRLKVRIENSIPQKAEINEGLGTGIRNLKARLSLLYPGNYIFQIIRDGEHYAVNMEVPIEHL